MVQIISSGQRTILPKEGTTRKTELRLSYLTSQDKQKEMSSIRGGAIKDSTYKIRPTTVYQSKRIKEASMREWIRHGHT